MIVRLLVLMIAGTLAYVMLRGWPAVMPEWLRSFVAILVVVAGLFGWTAGRKPKDLPLVKTGRKPGWLDYGAVGLVILALECGFLWFLSVTPGPLEEIAIRFEQQFRPEAARKREERSGAVTGGNWLWNDQRERLLPVRTNLKPGMKPEVFVRLFDEKDADALIRRQVYVRAFALDRYENGAWSSSDGEARVLTADEKGWIRFSDRQPREILHEVFHGSNEAGMNVFTALQGGRAVRLPSLTLDREGLAILPEFTDQLGYEYLASSMPLMLADMKESDLANVAVKSPDAGSRIGQLVLRVAGEGELLENLKKIENYLKSSYRYSLVTDNPKGLDPIENFLFEEKRGHCEFFATACALMVRELGVEVRLGYGWAGGKYFGNNRMFVFRAREAHAWVEVNVDGYGWVVMEPTPPEALGDHESRVAQAGEKMPTPDEILEEELAVMDESGENLAVWAMGLAGVFGISATVLIFLRRRTREGFVNASNPSSVRQRDTGYFAAWRRAFGKRSGSNGAGVTLRNQVQSLEESPDFSVELIRYHYSVRYEGRPVDPKLERGIEREIEKWERSSE